MIIGQYLLLELKLYLYISDYTIKVDGCAYKGCTAPMRDPYDLCDDASFRNEKLWESEQLINSTQRTRRLLDAKYQKADLSKFVSDSKHINNNKKSMLRDVLNKYEFLFDGTIGTWKMRPVDIELQPEEKPYHYKPCPVPRAHEAVFRKDVERLCQIVLSGTGHPICHSLYFRSL